MCMRAAGNERASAREFLVGVCADLKENGSGENGQLVEKSW